MYNLKVAQFKAEIDIWKTMDNSNKTFPFLKLGKHCIYEDELTYYPSKNMKT